MTNSYYGFILLYGLVINCYLYCNWELDAIILMDFHPVAEVKLFWSRPGRQIILVAASYILALSLLTPVSRICTCDQLHPPLIFWDSVPGSIKLKKCLPLQSKANWITPHTFLAWMKPFQFWQLNNMSVSPNWASTYQQNLILGHFTASWIDMESWNTKHFPGMEIFQKMRSCQLENTE